MNSSRPLDVVGRTVEEGVAGWVVWVDAMGHASLHKLPQRLILLPFLPQHPAIKHNNILKVDCHTINLYI